MQACFFIQNCVPLPTNVHVNMLFESDAVF